jgi:hypothetical protein
MKYKVGDKVKVRNDLKAYEIYGSNMLTKSMEKFAGKTVTISGVGITSYAIEEMKVAYWTDEMFEPVEEMSAEEAIKLSGKMCSSSACYECPVFKSREKYGEMCNVFKKEHAEEYLEILEQWKADHEKKDVEVEFACIVRVIEDADSGRRCVYEEDVTEVKDETFKMTMKRILEEYCKEHEGKFFTVYEEICRVKD